MDVRVKKGAELLAYLHLFVCNLVLEKNRDFMNLQDE